MDQAILDVLHGRARRIGSHLARWLPTTGVHNDWIGYGGEPLAIRIISPGTVRFSRDGVDLATIQFENIVPKEITREILHEPVLLGDQRTNVTSTKIVNSGVSGDVTRTFQLTVSKTTNRSHSVGVSVTNSIKAKIGTPDVAPVQAELEISASITADYNHTFGSSETESNTTSTTVVVPPGKVAFFNTSRYISNFEQRTEYWCNLDHTIAIYSRDDFRHVWNSLSEFEEALGGLAPETITLATYFRDNPSTEANIRGIIGQTPVYLDRTMRFSNAISGDVSVTQRDYAPATD